MGLQFTNQRLFALRGDKQNIVYWRGQVESSLTRRQYALFKIHLAIRVSILTCMDTFLRPSKDEVLVNHLKNNSSLF